MTNVRTWTYAHSPFHFASLYYAAQPSPISCTHYLLFRFYCYNYHKTAIVTFATITITIILLCY